MYTNLAGNVSTVGTPMSVSNGDYFRGQYYQVVTHTTAVPMYDMHLT